jgi:enterochelin esterase-like enzyme
MTVAERLPYHLHPRLAALAADPSGQAAFWEEVARERAPLVEPDPDASGFSVVTYVFPAPEGAGHVVVQPGFGQTTGNVMDRIPGTDVCHAAYRYRNDVRTSYSFVPDLPLFDWGTADAEQMKQFNAFAEANPPLSDPNHRECFVSRAGDGQPDHQGSFLSLPDAPDESLIHKRPDIARGWIDRHSFKSQILGNERTIWVYTPPGYKDGDQAYPVLVNFDGGTALSRAPVQRMLDNLLADGRIVPVVSVMIDNPTPAARNLDLPCSEPFARFIEEELLPWLRENYRVSEAPEDHYVTGVSYGGLASMWLGYRLPHVFGNVISQAASLWWGPGFMTDVPRSAGGYTPGWLIDQYEAAPRLPVRYWMEIGLLEDVPLMIEPNRRMKAVLEAKGYDLIYSEPNGGHDSALWRGTLAKALATMLAVDA